MNRNKKIIVLGLLFLLGFAFSVSWLSNKKKQPLSKWIVPTSMDLIPLVPHKVVSGEHKAFLSLIYDKLFVAYSGSQPNAHLLESWDFNPSDRVYQFRLRKGVKFHDGTPLTADDVLYSIHRWTMPGALDGNLLDLIVGAAEYRAEKAKSIEGFEVTGDLSFQIRVNASSDNLLEVLTMPRFVVMPRREEELINRNIGTGPFRFSGFSPQEFYFSANEEYFLGAPKLDKVVIRKYSRADAVAAFNVGEVNNLLLIENVDREKVTREDVVIDVLPSSSTYALVFSQNNKRNQSLDFRKAFTQKFLSSEFVDLCYEGGQEAASLIPLGLLRSPVQSPFSRQKFLTSMPAQGGIEIDSSTELYFVSGSVDHCLEPQLTRGDLSGISIKRAPLEEMYALFLKSKLSIFVEEYLFKNNDPISVLQYFDSASEEYLLSKPIPELSKLYRNLHQASDPTVREKVAQSIVAFLHENFYVVPLFSPPNFRIYHSSLRGFGTNDIYRRSVPWHLVEILE
ncbi:ABC transporter substrate-binding protein [bacterium]|nr:ABC transporter substrate-binding protein [bacterium]